MSYNYPDNSTQETKNLVDQLNNSLMKQTEGAVYSDYEVGSDASVDISISTSEKKLLIPLNLDFGECKSFEWIIYNQGASAATLRLYANYDYVNTNYHSVNKGTGWTNDALLLRGLTLTNGNCVFINGHIGLSTKGHLYLQCEALENKTLGIAGTFGWFKVSVISALSNLYLVSDVGDSIGRYSTLRIW